MQGKIKALNLDITILDINYNSFLDMVHFPVYQVCTNISIVCFCCFVFCKVIGVAHISDTLASELKKKTLVAKHKMYIISALKPMGNCWI